MNFLNELLLVGKESFFYAISGFLIAILVTPLYFLKTQRQSTGHTYSFIYNKYKENNTLLRSLFSGVFYIAILNSYASGIFGIVEGFSIPFIENLNINAYGINGILFRTILLGFSESIINIYFDFKAISKEKFLQSNQKTSIFRFSVLAFLKNTIGWASTMISIFLIYQLKHSFQIEISYTFSVIFSFCIGMIFSPLVLPFDVMCVQTVGVSSSEESVLDIIKKNIKNHGIKRLCYGGLMRIIILSCFSSATVLVDIILKN